MTNEYIIENNKLIAEFMGAIESAGGFYTLGGEILAHEADLKYHSDWNWLMPVVEKIESLGYEFSIHNRYVSIWTMKIEFLQFEVKEETKILSVFKACIEFLEYYNENK